MIGLKKSLSCRRQLPDENGGSHSEDGGQQDESHRRFSLDTLVIPGRIRYPSDETESSIPTTIDLHIANALLNRSCMEEGAQDESEQYSPFINPPEPFNSRYNRAAKRYGLSILDVSPKDEIGTTKTNNDVKHNAWSRIQSRLYRKSSLIHLTARHTSSAPLPQSLDDICRLGGVSILHLPRGYCFSPLSVPTCIAVTANYLIEHGRDTLGIFRIPGQTSVVTTLYDYYVSRIRCDDEGPDRVRTTVGSTDIPQALAVNVHDVASAFKKFLWDIPGGIIGSTSVFKTLREIESLSQSTLNADHLVKPRLAALALLSLQSKPRFHLILAVFGLLAFLKHDQDIHPSIQTSFHEENMSSKALGVVFAPVLLGNLTEGIELEIPQPPSRKSLLHYRKTPKRNMKTDCSPELKASLDRTNSASNIIEFLLKNWKDIIQQLYRLKDSSSSSTYRFCNLPKSVSQPAMGPDQNVRSLLGHGTMPWIEQKAILTDANTSLRIPSVSRYSTRHSRTESTESRNASASTPTFETDGQRVPLLQPNNSFRALRSSEEGEGNLAWWERFSHSRSETSVVITPPSCSVDLGHSHGNRNVQKTTAIPPCAQLQPEVATTNIVNENTAPVNPFLEAGEETVNNVDTHPVRDTPARITDNRHDEVVHVGKDSSSPKDIYEVGEVSQQGFVYKTEMSFPKNRLGDCENQDLELTPRPQKPYSPRLLKKRSLSTTPKPHSRQSDWCIGSRMTERLKRRADDSDTSNASTSIISGSSLNNENLSTELGQFTNIRQRVSILPLRLEDPIARHMSFRGTSSSDATSRYASENSEDLSWLTTGTTGAKLGTLFTEIRRQKMELDVRREEVTQLRQELDAMRRFKDAGTLSEKVREAEREMKFWKFRAEWAEKRLFGRGGSE